MVMALSNFCTLCGIWVSSTVGICAECRLAAGIRTHAGPSADPAERCRSAALLPAIHATRGMYWPCARRRATTT